MLLISFHGGDTGINNVQSYNTATGALLSGNALAAPSTGSLAELRAIIIANGQLYVSNGAKALSQVLCYGLPDAGGECAFISLIIGPTLSNKKQHFETAISHPFGIAFDDASTCFISNQDTNVVAQVIVTNNTGTLGSGCQSAYLNGLFKQKDFLDGTFVASQVGTLHVVKVKAPDVPASNGGLGVSFGTSGSKQGKVINSVRDVAVANGMLFVCDEVDKLINVYDLTDGGYLLSAAVATSPTHLEIENGGLWVSAGSSLHWGQLPASVTAPTLTLEAVTITPPAGNKIGGISFNGNNVYVAYQTGTGGETSGGSIAMYTVTQQSQGTLPVLSDEQWFLSSLTDTPEFVLFVD
jgi:hypothetical protein